MLTYGSRFRFKLDIEFKVKSGLTIPKQITQY